MSKYLERIPEFSKYLQKNMIKEHDRIVLLKDLPENGLQTGDVGTVVHIHRQCEAFEVEFMTLDGGTVAVVTLPSSQIRAVSKRDITHVRELSV
ncbi:MAG: DUF4926 domain-containing protein, partial [Candidatus Brocadia sp.]|nr:DUF4926 domain-containing protein [Candidatus Brocadia sp.]